MSGARVALIVAGDGGAPSATVDASSDVSDASEASSPRVCGSATVSFTSTYKPPRAPIAGQCTAQQIESFVLACAMPSDASGLCSGFFSTAPACAQCLSTQWNEAAWSAFVLQQDGTYAWNSGGCEELTVGAGCGKKLQDYRDCFRAACKGCEASFECHTFGVSPAACTSLQAARCADPAGPTSCAEGEVLPVLSHIGSVFCPP